MMNEYIGLVGHNSPGAGRGEEPTWTFSFSLLAYVNEAGQLHNEEVHIFKEVSDEELDKLMDKMKPYDIIKFKGLPVENEYRKQIQLESLIEVGIHHEELRAISEEHQAPVYYDSATFGKLALDKAYDYYKGETHWGKQKISLELSTDGGSVEEPEQFAQELFENQAEWNRKIESFIVSQLLALKNDTWLEDNEQRVDKAEFIRKITLEDISVHADGSFEFLYDDGYLFLGHCIIVNGTLEDGLEDAEIAG